MEAHAKIRFLVSLNRFPPFGEAVATADPEDIAFVEEGQDGLPFTQVQQVVRGLMRLSCFQVTRLTSSTLHTTK